MGVGELWIEADDLLELVPGFGDVVVCAEFDAEGEMRFPIIRVKFDGLAEALDGLGAAIEFGECAAHIVVSVGFKRIEAPRMLVVLQSQGQVSFGGMGFAQSNPAWGKGGIEGQGLEEGGLGVGPFSRAHEESADTGEDGKILGDQLVDLLPLGGGGLEITGGSEECGEVFVKKMIG